jgi:hypothetical protein
MADVVFDFLMFALGVAGGVWIEVGFHRRNPGYRDAPSFRRTLWASMQATWIIPLGLGVFALLAWALGELNAPYLAFVGGFAAVVIAGTFVWPIIRGRNRRSASA